MTARAPLQHNGTTILPYAGKTPKIHDSAFIAPGCRIIGDVEIGADVSIWYNCVIRADVNKVRIGARSNIQDGSVVHCDSPDEANPDGFPTIIGEDVLIGHMAMVHGCVLQDRAFVGLGSIVMSGATIESDGMLAAGAMLTGGKTIGPRQLWAGRPAKYMRDLNDQQLSHMQTGIAHYVENGHEHKRAVDAHSA
ncbi:gamma carbonic anhydrase family protein [Croceicoccus naphthovorans]|uniref:Carbonic anhydrase n=1 Tax=Croceicoccus naphthovorans TaxID=1348774 RepID=A0A0G3XKT2_9SPHN|nr:gamma carbonic anhydrase family protein [Croceicoccus naphthovorans]AKM11206.1 carbonic anhydrase [Croceicoccus naphthovorans]MBB3989897.1 carbonic anhydrase/acetyltransferase-like protein (isoleucine patch superfamily) [Croceicoccus naphthovorans]